MLRELVEKDFESTVKNSDKPVVLKFTADWWPGCKQLAPVVSAVSEELNNKVAFYSVDVDHSPGLAQQFSIQSIPTMILFKNGNEVDRLVGAAPEERVKEFSTK